jgi:thiol:disulfide interchange protein DsbC
LHIVRKSRFVATLLILCCFFAVVKLVAIDGADESSQQHASIASEETTIAMGDTVKDSQSDISQEVQQLSEDIEASVLSFLKAARPDIQFTFLGESPMPGVYEVQVENGPLLFVHERGEYLFQGVLLQVREGAIVDTMETRKAIKRRDAFAERSTEDMIIFKPEGESKAIMNVFTDVDCGYCRKFHQEVPQLNAMGIEVRYLAFPRAGIPSGSYNKIAKAWCADTKQDTLTRVKNGQNVDVEVCDNNPVAEHYAFGNSIGVTGTPAIILMDGTLIPGYQPAANFAKVLGISSK